MANLDLIEDKYISYIVICDINFRNNNEEIENSITSFQNTLYIIYEY